MSEKEKEKTYLEKKSQYILQKNMYATLTEMPIAYWLSKDMFSIFANKTLGEYAKPRQGMATSDNNKFLRLWFEVSDTKICFNAENEESAIASHKKWFPYNKGGGFRKWYGNNDYLINWENNGQAVKTLAIELYRCMTRTIKNIQFYFQEGVTWSTLASGSFNARYSGKGFLFDTKGSTCFFDDLAQLTYFLGLLNSTVSNECLKVLAPTLDYNAGSIAKIPIIYDSKQKGTIEVLVEKCLRIAKEDWDGFETSWDFTQHPLIRCSSFPMGKMKEDEKKNIKDMNYIEDAFTNWQNECFLRFNKLKANEEELNRIFIDIYGLQDELIPEVEDKDVTVRKADLQRDIKSLISYAVGCMFGRYSLDVEGLAYAGGEWDDSKYSTFIPEKDNIILITDEQYFEDDILGLFCSWLKKVYGKDTLEQNLDFIASALSNKGSTSREIIRNYFVNDFFKDHCATYSVTGSGKRPIYWLFDSGKQNGFKALIYLHRYNADTIGNLRVDYLHRIQRVYESEIERMQDMIDHTTNSREVAAATKRKEKLQKQLKECRDYDEKIGHLALSRIELDLDDGVKVNYEKVQTAKDGKKYQVLAKI